MGDEKGWEMPGKRMEAFPLTTPFSLPSLPIYIYIYLSLQNYLDEDIFVRIAEFDLRKAIHPARFPTPFGSEGLFQCKGILALSSTAGEGGRCQNKK